MPHLKKFSKKSNLAFSAQNQMCEGVRSKEVDAPKRRGFRGSRFTFRCHDATNVNKRERDRGRERERNTQKAPNTINIKEYRECKVRMHENA